MRGKVNLSSVLRGASLRPLRSKTMKITIRRFVSGEYGRRWYHRFKWLDRAFDRAPTMRRKMPWTAKELNAAK